MLLTRRAFLLSPAGLVLARALGRQAIDLRAFERARVLRLADAYLREPPITITATSSPRSAGGPHDYFSEGDYWWPDPEHPGGPYIQRDGMTNPDNFVAHRHALIRLRSARARARRRVGADAATAATPTTPRATSTPGLRTRRRA